MPLIIPIFIPHEGCPHACIFCNQHRISGEDGAASITPDTVRETITTWLERQAGREGERIQVAFYGGSFTGLPVPRQLELLQAVEPFLGRYLVGSIRLSTRPDYVDVEKVKLLFRHGVATVELGVQSLDDRVLAASNRGHTAAQTKEAVGILRKEGMEVGLQIMLGLPGQTTRSLMRTVKETAALQPDFVRIYPVLVLRDSGLAGLFVRGQYRPLSLGKAVAQAVWMKRVFDRKGIRVVRIGLQPGPELERSLVAGPYHPAFGELVSSRIMLRQTRKLIREEWKGERLVLSISDRDVSVFRGMQSGNIRRLHELGLAVRFTLVTDREQPRGTIRKMETTG